MALEPGYVLAGKYRIERLLGEGGMGAVYAARHLQLGGRVALKLMLEHESSADAVARFRREARAASQLRGEHIVRTLDADRLDDGTPFIVLEYIDGVDLDEVLKERGPLPVEEAVNLIVQACEGVAEAHACGMVHRDLKLRNLLRTTRTDGRPLLKIVDFGVVKIAKNLAESGAESAVTLTRADAFIGSAHYMAPEQMQMSSKVDARADVWSLGVCLYRLLSGKRPFDGETIMEVVSATLRGQPKSIAEHRPDVPPEVARAVERALEKNLQRRFQTVAELAGAIARTIGDAHAFERIDAVLRGGRPKTEAAVEPSPGPEAVVPGETTVTLPTRPLPVGARDVVATDETVPLLPPAVVLAPPVIAPARSRRAVVVVTALVMGLTLVVLALFIARKGSMTNGPETGSPPTADSSSAVTDLATASPSTSPSSFALPASMTAAPVTTPFASAAPSSVRTNRATAKPKTPPRPSSSAGPYDQF